MTKTLDQIQREIGEWATEQFGDNVSKDRSSISFNHPLGSIPSLLGIVEEVGELCRAVARRHQGRGYEDIREHREAKEDALADMLVFTCDYANREAIQLNEVLDRVWTKVCKRRQESWAKDKAKEVKA
jgi:NTP pyrophosphatase (non-canonical NTP hydrolase)